ncbi:uncharacterized protein LOC128265620 isoform X1 [Drosophila gunungcola]|uniref:uncharacterized protein LOC128265620 isoform X1 n=1 Tax=Drosophila gunungcola TaxID=103775 RepID=UPI0022E1E50C|nr:uncharacterized protein LOC128265620 isoform X1 [Drosophila gunungcola]
MGRPRLVDTSNLVVLLPNRTCRCVVCDKILAGLQRSNIKRHYERLHPDIVLQRPPRPQSQPKPQRQSTRNPNTKTGRPQLVDTGKLCEILSDGKRCRCKLCEKVLTHRPGNVRRHYSIYHPHIIVQLAPKRWVIAEDKLIPNRQRLNNPDASHLPTNSTIENTDFMEDDEAGDGDNEDNVSGSQFDGIFKSELPDDEDDQSVDSRDVELETIEVTMAKPSISLKPATTQPAPSVASSSTSVVPARAPTAAAAAATPTPLIRAPSSSDCPLAGEDAFYLQYLGNKLSKYSARTKNTVQFQINRILYRADMGRFENADPKEADSDLYF